MFFIYLITYSLIAVFLSSCAQLPFDNGDGRTGPIDTKAQFSISGNPRTEAYIGFGYQFKPKVTKFNEKDVITFTIENKPTWLALDTTTGELSGFPAKSDRGSYPDIQLSVTNGKDIKYLQPFAIKVTQWKGFGYCSGVNSDGDTLCTPISSNYVIDSQCQSWADMQGLRNPILHIYDKQSTLITNAKAVCSTPPIFGNHCPKGYVKVKQIAQIPGEISCMEDLSKEEFARNFSESMTLDIANYLASAEQDVIPDFTPLEPEIEQLADGTYKITLPPPISQQNAMEKQRRSQNFGPALNSSGDCAKLVGSGSFWNKIACFSWDKGYGDDTIGVTLDAMSYMRVSGDSAISAKVTGKLFGKSADLVRLFGKIQVYAAPGAYVGGTSAANIISASANGNAKETLSTILGNAPTLRGPGTAQVSSELTNAVHDASRALEQSRVEAETALSKTQAEIDQAKAKFSEAEAKLSTATEKLNAEKIAAEQAIQNVLPSLDVEKTELLGSLEVWNPKTGQLKSIWPGIHQSARGQQSLMYPPTSAAPLVNKTITIFQSSKQFMVGPVPVVVSGTIAANFGLSFKAYLNNPLKPAANVGLSVEPKMSLDATGKAGVGIKLASAGVKMEVNVIEQRFGFNLSSKASDFPKMPLAFVTWNADILKGRIALYAEMHKVVMKIVMMPIKIMTGVLNWIAKVVGYKKKLIPEIKISNYEKTLFRFDSGLHFAQTLYCSRPGECEARPLNKRFKDNGDGTVTDLKTDIIWKRCAEGQTWNGNTCTGTAVKITLDYAMAHDHISCEGGDQWPEFTGYREWLTPSTDELRTLIWCSNGQEPAQSKGCGENGIDYQKPTIDTTAFPNMPPGEFLAPRTNHVTQTLELNENTEPAPGGETIWGMWVVDFINGISHISNNPGAYVRLRISPHDGC